jgi:uncharacterized protein YjdB
MTRAALAKLSVLGAVALLAVQGAGCSRGASVTGLKLTPTSATFEIGATQQFSVSALFDDGTNTALTSGVTWTSSNASVATISVSGLATGVTAGATTIQASASGFTATAALTITPRAVTSVAVAPATVSLAAGLTQQLTVTATLDDGSTQDVTSSAAYASSAAAVATVSSGGLVSAAAPGTATITATAGGKSGTCAVTVTAATVKTLTLTPSTVALIEVQTKQLAVLATYSDGTSTSTPAGLAYSTSAAAVATVNSAGLVTAVAKGSATITAAAGGKTATAAVTVTSKSLLSIAATPNPITVPVGGNQTITVKGTYDNGTTATIASGLTFTSSATSTVGVSPDGIVLGKAAGNATITVAVGSITTQVPVTVTASQISALAISPSPVSLFVSQTQALTVTATFSDGSSGTISTGLTWLTSDQTKATVSDAGLVTAIAAGPATITASAATTAGAVTATVNVTVNPLVLQSIAAAPASVALAVGGTQQLTITGTYQAGITANLTATSTFSGYDTAVCAVNTAGLVTAIAVGSTTVTVNAAGKSTTVAVSVTTSASVFFHGAFASDVNPTLVGFGGSQNSISIDTDTANDLNGFHALKIVEPAGAAYTGGAWVATAPRDASKYNAITFYAKADRAISLPVTGFGDDANGNATFKTEVANLALTTSFQKYVLPIPDPSKLTATTGLFYFADGVNFGGAMWLADIQYESLSPTPGGTPAPVFTGASKTAQVGGTASIGSNDLSITYSSNLAATMPNPLVYTLAGPGFFTFTAAQSGLVSVASPSGLITGVAAGSTTLTGKINGVSTSNTLGVTVIAPLPAPLVAAPTPAQDPAKVTSLWSSVKYNGTAADLSPKVNFSEFNGNPNPYQGSVAIAGSNPKKFVFQKPPGHYSGFGFHTAVADEVDVAGKGYDTLHMDFWSPDIATPNPSQLVVGLINFGAAGGTGFSTQGNLVLSGVGITNSTSTAANGGWVSYDFKIADFNKAGLEASPHNIAQMLLQADFGATVYMDNLYFYNSGTGTGGGPTGPATLPPAPGVSATSTVYSLYSSLTPGGLNGTTSDFSAKVGTWDAAWSGAPAPQGAPTSISVGSATASPRKYVFGSGAQSFVGIEFIGRTSTSTEFEIDAAGLGMDTFHLDLYTPDDSTNFQIKLHDAGADRAVGTADDSEGIFLLTAGTTPALATNKWLSLDIPLTSFTTGSTLANFHNLAQLILQAPNGGTVYVDNVYFYKKTSAGTSGPSAAAPAPARAAANVVSLFSSAYSGTAADYSSHVDSWYSVCFSDGGGAFTGADYTGISGHPVKGYNLQESRFAAVEFIGSATGADLCGGAVQSATSTNPIDVTAMSGLHLDVWTDGALPMQNFQVQLVAAGPDGVINGPGATSGDDVIATFTIPSGALSALAKNQWNQLDLPFSASNNAAGLQSSTRVGLLKIFYPGTGGTTKANFYLDNVYFYKDAPAAPTTPAPVPAAPAANVLWLYNSSGTYSATSTQVAVQNWTTGWGNLTSYSTYTITGTSSVVQKYAGLQYTGVDFTNVDASATGMLYLHVDVWTAISPTEFGLKIGTAGAGQFIYAITGLTAGAWNQVDIPLSALTGVDLTKLNEFLPVDNIVDSNEHGTFFLDNVYFHK